jgi:hypothetical protein
MRDPTPDELAAIVAAYAVVSARYQTSPPSAVSRWRMAGRLPARAPLRGRPAGATSRWNAAGRFDG